MFIKLQNKTSIVNLLHIIPNYGLFVRFIEFLIPIKIITSYTFILYNMYERN